ncbi:MAG: RNA polymerase sigma factor [Phycisphaerales bacterium]
MSDRPEELSEAGAGLLGRAIAGDVVALERLLVRYQSRLLARLRRKLPASLARVIAAEDVLQDAFLAVFRGIRSFRPSGPLAFERWLITITDNCMLDAIRAAAAAKRGGGWTMADAGFDGSRALSMLDMVAIDSHTPSRSTANRELAAAVVSAIERIRPDYREAVRLRFLEGRAIPEIAAKLGRTDWSVHKLCARGLRELETELSPHRKSRGV